MDQKGTTSQLPAVKSKLSEGQSGRAGKFSSTEGCFNCGLTTHLVKECSYPKQPREAHGIHSALSVVSSVDKVQIILVQIVKLQKELKEKEVTTVMEEAVMHGITTPEGTTPAKIAPTINVYTKVVADRMKMTALIDTGSPVTLMSP